MKQTRYMLLFIFSLFFSCVISAGDSTDSDTSVSSQSAVLLEDLEQESVEGEAANSSSGGDTDEDRVEMDMDAALRAMTPEELQFRDPQCSMSSSPAARIRMQSLVHDSPFPSSVSLVGSSEAKFTLLFPEGAEKEEEIKERLKQFERMQEELEEAPEQEKRKLIQDLLDLDTGTQSIPIDRMAALIQSNFSSRTDSSAPKISVSLDGGGVRILLSLYLIENLERLSGVPFFLWGDAYAGTSAGALAIAALLCPKEPGSKEPLYTPHDVIDILLKNAGIIFSRTRWQALKNPKGLMGPKYKSEPLEDVLSKVLPEWYRLSDMLRPSVLTAFDVNRGVSHFFKSRRAIFPGENFMLRSVLRVVMAAPTYFPAATIHSLPDSNGGDRSVTAMDGGIFMNNPSFLALLENFTAYQTSLSSIYVISLGTGKASNVGEEDVFKTGGALSVIRPLIDAMMSGTSHAIDHILERLLYSGGTQKYFRLNPVIDSQHKELDDASEQNLKRLEAYALNYMEQSHRLLKEVAKVLKQRVAE